MGGQATLFSSSFGNASAYDIRAAVLHRAFTHSFPTPCIPFLYFTGEADDTAPPSTMALPIFNSAAQNSTFPPRGFIDKTLTGHHEPDILSKDLNGIALLAQFSAAWFKLHLDNTPRAYGIDFEAMIYSNGADGLCGGGDGEMTTCTLIKP